MRSSRLLVVGAAVALAAGLVIGLMPIGTTLTEISPRVRLVAVSCGDGYLPANPPARPGELVEVPTRPPLLLTRSSYAQHCGLAVGWRRHLAWLLTVLGALGLAVRVATTRTARLGR